MKRSAKPIAKPKRFLLSFLVTLNVHSFTQTVSNFYSNWLILPGTVKEKMHDFP